MHKYFCTLVMCFLSFATMAQETIEGKVTGRKMTPLEGVIIFNKTNNSFTTSGKDGTYKLPAVAGDTIIFSRAGFETFEFQIKEGEPFQGTKYDFSLAPNVNDEKSDPTTTPLNYWNGAVLAFNIDGDSENNIIGSAGIVINKITPRTNNDWIDSGEIMLVGNIGNFLGSVATKEQIDSGIRRVIQDAQGLNLGISFFRQTPTGTPSERNTRYNRLYFVVGYRYNSFQNVNGEGTSSSLSQNRNTLAYEYESAEWNNGGRFTFCISPSVSFFSKSSYEKIFQKDIAAIGSINVNSVVPLASNFGAMMSYTFSTAANPVFQVGVIVKNFQVN